jgi:hypothetical protein
VLIKERSKVFLGGPPLVKMATGEDADEEELGGAEMHARTSGLGDYLADDELDAIRITRQIVATSTGASSAPARPQPADPPVHDPEELLGIASVDLREPFDAREVIARVVDGSRFEEFKPPTAPTSSPAGGRSTATRSGSSPTTACCSARRPRRARSSSSSATASTSRSSSCRTSPGSWSAPSTSRAASSRTAPS